MILEVQTSVKFNLVYNSYTDTVILFRMEAVRVENYDSFLAIAETGNISRAAEKLYVSQPSLSKYLRRLERDLGAALFDRSSYPLKLTEAGMLYLNYVREERLRARNLRRGLENLRSPDKGEVRVGLTPWRSSSLLPDLFADFWKFHPNIRVYLEEGAHKHLASLIERDRVDFALTHLPNQYEGFSCTHEFLTADGAVFAVSSAHPLVSALPAADGIGTIGESEFALFQNEAFVMFQESQNIYEMIHAFLERAGVVPNVRLVTPNIHTAMSFVRRNQGVGFATVTYAEHRRDDGLRFFFLGDEPMKWDVVATYKKGRPLSPQARMLLDSIRSVCAGKSGGGGV